jgi:hypothetical protein
LTYYKVTHTFEGSPEVTFKSFSNLDMALAYVKDLGERFIELKMYQGVE